MSPKRTLVNCGELTVQAQGRVSLQKQLEKHGIKQGDSIIVYFEKLEGSE